mgnify:CR=1 FL=1
MSGNRTRAPRRPTRWLAVALIAFLSASCQFLGLDMYPPELQVASVNCDLPALVAEKTGYTLNSVETMRQLGSGSTKLLFVLCNTTSGNVVMVLDPVDLSYRSHLAGASLPLGVDAAGYFMAGNNGYDPSTGTWASLSTTVPIHSYSVLLVSDTDANPNVLMKAEGSSLSILAAENPWPAAMPGTFYIAPVTYPPIGNWRIEDATASSSETRILLRNNWDGLVYYIDYAGRPSALCTDVGTNMLTTGFLAKTTTAFTFYGEGGRCWLLGDSIAYVENDRESRITRRSYTDGSVIDSHLIDPSWKDSIYFEPAGERWYYYDTRISKLCVLRTWW